MGKWIRIINPARLWRYGVPSGGFYHDLSCSSAARDRSWPVKALKSRLANRPGQAMAKLEQRKGLKMKNVLFLQGAGEGAHEEDGELVKSLQAALGAEYVVAYPKMPNEGETKYEELNTWLSKEIDAMSGDLILVGHSAGGSFLIKYLSEEKVEKPVAGIFLIAAPYMGPEGWLIEEGALQEGFASRLPKGAPVFLDHSRDDEWVPFAHLAIYAEKLPHAVVREFDGGGHQFNNDLSAVAADIVGLEQGE